MDFDAELLGVFVASCQEQLADIEQHVLALESGVGSGHVDAIFRAAHSIKADAAAMGFDRVSEFAHHIEDVLHLVRSGRLNISGQLIEALLGAFDSLRRMALDPTRHGDLDVSSALMALGRVLYAALTTAPAEESAVQTCSVRGEASARSSQDLGEHETRFAQVTIPAAKLDHLVDQLGELVAVQARLDACARQAQGAASVTEDLARLLGGLRDQVMALRLVSLKPVFAKFRRLVRDAAAQTGKQVGFVVSGEDTVLDKSAVEHVQGPLTHIVRNAVDHGIEPPLIRVAAGKNPEGLIQMRARQIGGEVEILVRDDGRGMVRSVLVQRAVDRGLLTSAQDAASLDLVDLICLPGLSTADQVSSYSGRGVGMDAAREAILALRGTLDVRSEPGLTEVRVRIPLSLAMLDCLHVVVGPAAFFIQLPSVEECLEVRRTDLALRHGRGVIDWRGVALPVLCLASWGQMPRAGAETDAVVVVRAGGARLGLVVDGIVGHRQIVLKQISRVLGRLDGILGGAVTEAGTMALVLDIPALVRRGLSETGPGQGRQTQ